MPFVNLALVPELGSSYLAPAQAGYIAAAELILLGSPFDARRALEYSTRVISADFKEAMTAFFEKRRPDFTKTKN